MKKKISLKKQNFWRKKIAEWKSSGLGRNKFCQIKKLSHHSLSYWQTKFNKIDGQQKEFIPLRITSPLGEAPIKIRLNNGVVIELPSTVSLATLKELVLAL